MFARVDHIGVAVDDLDAAIALHERDYGMQLVHREVIDEHRIAAELLENETLERAQIDRIMEGVPRVERRRPVPELRVAAAKGRTQAAD